MWATCIVVHADSIEGKVVIDNLTSDTATVIYCVSEKLIARRSQTASYILSSLKEMELQIEQPATTGLWLAVAKTSNGKC